MRITIPHTLGRAEVRQRLKARSGDLEGQIPGGMASITAHWDSEYRLALSAEAMGQTLAGSLEIEDGQVVIEMTLPGAMAFIEPMVEKAVRQQGQKLLT